MSFLTVSGIAKTEDGNYVVKNISFQQARLQKIAIAGATGSGKTTLLKMIAGLAEPTEGAIFFNNEKVLGPNEKLLPGHTGIAYLSQHFELRNHYRVIELLEMAAKLPDANAKDIYEICRIQHLLQRWTHQLSGGEKQRIALAKLLVTSPQLLLLDEPYSNLDPFHKQTLKTVIDSISAELNITCTLVSHEPADTLSWADEIIVLKNGELWQQGKPEEVYSHPVDEYAAALFGKYNVLAPSLLHALQQNGTPSNNNSIIRPKALQLVEAGAGIKGKVFQVQFMGSFYEAEVELMDQKVWVQAPTPHLFTNGWVYVSM